MSETAVRIVLRSLGVKRIATEAGRVEREKKEMISMPFFQWKESFNTGHQEIDYHHQAYFDMLNAYYDSVTGGTKDSIGQELVGNLRLHVTRHLRFEEELMRKANYDGLERQCSQHLYFEGLVSDLEMIVHEGRSASLKSSLSLLRDWLLRHILEEDKQFAFCLNRETQDCPGN